MGRRSRTGHLGDGPARPDVLCGGCVTDCVIRLRSARGCCVARDERALVNGGIEDRGERRGAPCGGCVIGLLSARDRSVARDERALVNGGIEDRGERRGAPCGGRVANCAGADGNRTRCASAPALGALSPNVLAGVRKSTDLPGRGHPRPRLAQTCSHACESRQGSATRGRPRPGLSPMHSHACESRQASRGAGIRAQACRKRARRHAKVERPPAAKSVHPFSPEPQGTRTLGKRGTNGHAADIERRGW
jgi:hypothetical protein